MVLAVAILLLAGLLLRLPGLDTPSVEQRENQSSLLARGWYLGDGDGLPVWKQRVLDEVDTVLEPFEPPLLEVAAAGFYRTTDGERIWFPRLLSAIAWIVGAAILALIARRITNTAGLLTAVALYLVWPYAAWHSRKFMPDALMVSCLLAAVLAVVRYWEQPSRRRLLVASGAAAVATAIKPGVAFLIVTAVFVGLAVSQQRLRAETRSGRLPLFVGLAASLSLAYVAIGRYATDFINPDATTNRLTPDLVLTSEFWRGWWEMVSFLLRSPQPQVVLAVAALAVGVLASSWRPRACHGRSSGASSRATLPSGSRSRATRRRIRTTPSRSSRSSRSRSASSSGACSRGSGDGVSHRSLCLRSSPESSPLAPRSRTR